MRMTQARTRLPRFPSAEFSMRVASVLPALKRLVSVSRAALGVREALGARDLAALEPQPGEPVAAHGGVAAAAARQRRGRAGGSVAVAAADGASWEHDRRSAAQAAVWTARRKLRPPVSTRVRSGARPRGVERRAHRGRQPPPQPPRRAAERQVRDRREARLVLAQREQQVRDAVGGRQLGRRPSRTSSRRAGRRAGPAARRPRRRARRRAGRARARGPVRACSVARLVADQVAEQAERRPLGPGRRRAARGRTTFAPRLAYSAGIPHACTTAIAATGNESGSSAISSAAVARNGIVCASVVSVQSRPRRRSRAASIRGRQ